MSKVSERTSFRSPERVVKFLLQIQHLGGRCGHRGDVEAILKSFALRIFKQATNFSYIFIFVGIF